MWFVWHRHSCLGALSNPGLPPTSSQGLKDLRNASQGPQTRAVFAGLGRDWRGFHRFSDHPMTRSPDHPISSAHPLPGHPKI